MIKRAFGKLGMTCFEGFSPCGLPTEIILSKPNPIGEIALLVRRRAGDVIDYRKHNCANRVAAMRYVASAYGLPF